MDEDTHTSRHFDSPVHGCGQCTSIIKATHGTSALVDAHVRNQKWVASPQILAAMIRGPIPPILVQTAVSSLTHQWGPSPQALEAIINDGKIPLILVETPARSFTIRFRVISCEPDVESRYFAISHVWSHGRGNPTANQLNICQLDYIAELCSQGLYLSEQSTLAFWVDTLCVPVRPTILGKKAILQMRSICANALATAVLDENLECLPVCSSVDSYRRNRSGALNSNRWGNMVLKSWLSRNTAANNFIITVEVLMCHSA